MAIHVQDEEADRMVREFARQRGVGITAAIKLAISEATSRCSPKPGTLVERIRPIVEEIRAKRAGRPPVDQKALMDEMWGEID